MPSHCQFYEPIAYSEGIEWKTRRASRARETRTSVGALSSVLNRLGHVERCPTADQLIAARKLAFGPFSHVLPHCRAVPSRSPSRILNHSLSEDKKYQGAARMPKIAPFEAQHPPQDPSPDRDLERPVDAPEP